MRVALMVLVGFTAACKQLPDIPPAGCGNHLVDGDEDCDSGDDPNCGQPGTPDACRLKCVAPDGGGAGGCRAGEICGPTGYCRPTKNVCGNQVVDPGEDCDSDAANCGQPGDGAQACRFLCNAANTACPAGYFCGRDQICRSPTGTYTLGTASGDPASFFGLLDVNGDGFPDLVERGLTELTIRANDQHGNFNLLGSGPVHLIAPLGSIPGIDTPQAPLATQPLLAVESRYGIELMAIAPKATLQPLVAVTAVLPAAVGLKQFVGTIRRDPTAGDEALYYDPQAHVLDSFAPPADYTSGAVAKQVSSLDPSRAPCSHRPNKVAATIATPTGKLSTIALKMDDTVFCIATVNASGGFDLAPLDLSTMGTNLWIEQRPLFADVDGDGELDVVLHDNSTSFGRVIVFRKLGAGYRAPVAMDLNQVVSPYNIAAFDMNNDGRDDLLYAGSVYLNRTAQGVPDGGFNTDAGLEWQVPPVEEATFMNDQNFAADINHDRDGDLILSSSTTPDLLVCLGDGSGARFTCNIETTLIGAVQDVVLADVNGDQINDVLALSVPAGSSALANDGMDLFLGRTFMAPDQVGVALPVYKGTLDGAGRLPSTAHIADDLLAAITTSNMKQGVSVGVADSQSGQPAFAFPFADARDLRFVDEDRDGYADLMLLQQDRVTILHGGATVPFAGGLKVVSGQDAQGNWIFPDPSATGLTPLRLATLPGDPLPAVVGVDLLNGVVIAHLQSDGFHAKSYMLGNPLETIVQVADLDGDGNNEIVVFWNDMNSGNTCNVAIGSFAAGAVDPTISPTTTVNGCAADTFMLADSPPFDGRLDMWLLVPDQKNNPHWIVLRAKPDWSFDATAPPIDPAIFNVAGHAQPFDFNWSWIQSHDVNGDGIDDLLVYTPSGGAVLFADVGIP
jgi:hypothetical protein